MNITFLLLLYFLRPGETYGVLNFYDKTMDKVTVKNNVQLGKFQAAFYSVNTTDDPVLQKVGETDGFCSNKFSNWSMRKWVELDSNEF